MTLTAVLAAGLIGCGDDTGDDSGANSPAGQGPAAEEQKKADLDDPCSLASVDEVAAAFGTSSKVRTISVPPSCEYLTEDEAIGPIGLTLNVQIEQNGESAFEAARNKLPSPEDVDGVGKKAYFDEMGGGGQLVLILVKDVTIKMLGSQPADPAKYKVSIIKLAKLIAGRV